MRRFRAALSFEVITTSSAACEWADDRGRGIKMSIMRAMRVRKLALASALSGFVAATVNLAAPPGEALTGEVRANATAAGHQSAAAVARRADGGYVVVWAGNGSGDAVGIHAQRYNHNGVAVGGEF